MDEKNTAYAIWVGLSWSGLPMMFLNDNYYSVRSYDGEWWNWGQFIWAVLGIPFWTWLMWTLVWYEFFMPVPAAKLILDGYGTNRAYLIDPSARKRLESRAVYSEGNGYIDILMLFIFFSFFYQLIQYFYLFAYSEMGFNQVVIG